MASTNVPGTRNELIEFYKQHYEIWEASAALIGLSPASATLVKDLTDKAAASLAAANLARNASKSATAILNADAEALRAAGGAAVATIRAFAETSGNPDVYDIAKLAPPAPPAPVQPPTSPTDFTADPNADGTISLKWKGTVAQNQSFDLERSIDGGAYVLIGNRRAKKFLDNKVPMNSAMINYRAYGLRDGVRSESPATTTVLFGNLPPEIQAAFRSGSNSAAA